tara:strand:+ start:168 stop:284 length:117 start_codon:yes stop_codon:yes gene_type:complete
MMFKASAFDLLIKDEINLIVDTAPVRRWQLISDEATEI